MFINPENSSEYLYSRSKRKWARVAKIAQKLGQNKCSEYSVEYFVEYRVSPSSKKWGSSVFRVDFGSCPLTWGNSAFRVGFGLIPLPKPELLFPFKRKSRVKVKAINTQAQTSLIKNSPIEFLRSFPLSTVSSVINQSKSMIRSGWIPLLSQCHQSGLCVTGVVSNCWNFFRFLLFAMSSPMASNSSVSGAAKMTPNMSQEVNLPD